MHTVKKFETIAPSVTNYHARSVIRRTRGNVVPEMRLIDGPTDRDKVAQGHKVVWTCRRPAKTITIVKVLAGRRQAVLISIHPPYKFFNILIKSRYNIRRIIFIYKQL